MAYETIELKLEGGVARLTLNRPDRLNSFTVQMHDEVADALGRLDEARARAREALQLFADADDVSGYATLLDVAAVIAFREGDRLRAARLSGAVEELARVSGLDAFDRTMLDVDADALASAPDTQAAWQEGAAMERSAVIAYALEGL